MPSTPVTSPASTPSTPSPAPSAPAKAKGASPASKARAKRVAAYKPTTMVAQPAKVTALVTQLAKAGTTNAKGALALGKVRPSGNATTGQYAFACYRAGLLPSGQQLPLLPYGSKAKGAPSTPGQLASMVATAKAQGASWGQLAATYNVPEWGAGSVRAAYTAHTGTPWQQAPGAGAWRGVRG
jgi:hypothetical protein